MAFEQDLRAYLEERERGSLGNAPVPHVDEHELYGHLRQRLRELENAGATARVELLFNEWPNKLAQFARYLEAAPGLRASADAQERRAFAFRALDMALNCLDPDLALVERLEAERTFAGFTSGLALESYALENHLVRRDQPHPARLTELGRVFLRLRGKDAVRWLMTCEVAQSYGRRDPWHAPRELFQEAITADRIEMEAIGRGDTGYNGQTVDRIERLGVLIDYFFEYRLRAEMQDVVQAVLEPGPWHNAVRALLADERALVLPGVGASEATIEQAKLIVHEVRNALIPVRYDLEALASLAVDSTQQQHVEGAKQGITSVLNFVDDMVQMSELITEPAVPCEIGAVVDQALRWVGAGGRVQRTPFAAASYVRAPPGRFAQAISKVVGNALQATTAGQPVRLSITRTSGTVRVIVDDGGPGVLAEHRARIFLEGVTMRPDGTGTGFGLAFARRVVEGTLRGKIWCEDSVLGGARFVIEVPEASSE